MYLSYIVILKYLNLEVCYLLSTYVFHIEHILKFLSTMPKYLTYFPHLKKKRQHINAISFFPATDILEGLLSTCLDWLEHRLGLPFIFSALNVSLAGSHVFLFSGLFLQATAFERVNVLTKHTKGNYVKGWRC